jgi:hypothetical protein
MVAIAGALIIDDTASPKQRITYWSPGVIVEPVGAQHGDYGD